MIQSKTKCESLNNINSTFIFTLGEHVIKLVEIYYGQLVNHEAFFFLRFILASSAVIFLKVISML